MATPVDYSGQETERDVYTLESGDPLFGKKSFDQPVPPRSHTPRPKPQTQSQQPKPKPAQVNFPADLPSSFYEANGESYLKARRVAEMKFNTIKLVFAFSFISVGLVAVNAILYPEIMWAQWPVGAWAFVLMFPVIKSFVFRGKDIRSVIEQRLHKMALREVERFDTDLD